MKAVVLFLGLVFSFSEIMQSQVMLYGKVQSDRSISINKALVEILPARVSTFSDKKGNFEISAPGQPCTLNISAPGYLPYSQHLEPSALDSLHDLPFPFIIQLESTDKEVKQGTSFPSLAYNGEHSNVTDFEITSDGTWMIVTEFTTFTNKSKLLLKTNNGNVWEKPLESFGNYRLAKDREDSVYLITKDAARRLSADGNSIKLHNRYKLNELQKALKMFPTTVSEAKTAGGKILSDPEKNQGESQTHRVLRTFIAEDSICCFDLSGNTLSMLGKGEYLSYTPLKFSISTDDEVLADPVTHHVFLLSHQNNKTLLRHIDLRKADVDEEFDLPVNLTAEKIRVYDNQVYYIQCENLEDREKKLYKYNFKSF